MTFEDFITKFPEAKKSGKNFMVRCPAHGDKNASLSIAKGRDGIILKCFAGCTAKEVAESIGLRLRDLFYEEPKKEFKIEYRDPQPAQEEPKQLQLVASYDYLDETGQLLYQALRYEPKTFRQRAKDKSGSWAYKMDGVRRVLYNLPKVISADRVWIVEGEKDADRLLLSDHVATTNVGGAKKWLDPYSEALKGKEVVICGDNDKPGQEHVEQVFESVSKTAKCIRIVKLPETVKDISEYLDQQPDPKAAIEALYAATTPYYGGVKLPFYTMAQIQPYYKKAVRETATTRLDLSSWLPSFNRVRPLWPGEFALFVADTAVGKTAILQNIGFAAKSLTSLFLEQELPKELLYERFLAIMNRMSCADIENNYRSLDDEIPNEILDKIFGHILICEEPGLTPKRLEELIRGSELILDKKPQIAIVDYVQLMQGTGSTPYAKATDVAESLKRIAKACNVVMVVCSQIQRPPNHEGVYEPGLHSAKDSGAFENSAGLVVGAWRDGEDPKLMHMKVLKSTKGGAGTRIQCNFEGETMRITERAKQTEEV